jgi:transposase InsO family protein
MSRVQTILEARSEPKALRYKRGPRRQRRRRQAERVARISALVFARLAHGQGLSLLQAATRLGIDPSTLRVWRERWAEDHLQPKERGRPTDRVNRDQLWSLLAVFGLIGPQVGLPTLQSLLPDIPRAALVSLQARCRAIYRRKASWVIYALRWTCPGAVWAIDFAEPPEPIEGIYTHLLVVRDLPSGYVLIAIPTIAESATLVVHVLASLFKWFGVPLVLKSDNGGPFITDEVKALLREHNVLPLYSPPGTPRYNGSVEAGIGSIKVRAFWQAALADRPGQWTCDDIEAAVHEANTTGRPRQLTESSPQEAWLSRVPITDGQRAAFHETYDGFATEEYTRRGWLPMARLQHHEQSSLDRAAISRALVELGFLLIRRRRITPPVSRLRLRKIS